VRAVQVLVHGLYNFLKPFAPRDAGKNRPGLRVQEYFTFFILLAPVNLPLIIKPSGIPFPIPSGIINAFRHGFSHLQVFGFFLFFVHQLTEFGQHLQGTDQRLGQPHAFPAVLNARGVNRVVPVGVSDAGQPFFTDIIKTKT